MKESSDSSFKDMVDSTLSGIASMFKKGPAEKAGRKIDHTVRKTKQALRSMKSEAKKY